MEQTHRLNAKSGFSAASSPPARSRLGNYIGALRNFKLLEDQYDCLFSVV